MQGAAFNVGEGGGDLPARGFGLGLRTELEGSSGGLFGDCWVLFLTRVPVLL